MNMNRCGAIHHVWILLVILLITVIIIPLKYTPDLGSQHLLAWQHTHIFSVGLAPAVELMFTTLGLIKPRRGVNKRVAANASTS